MHVFRNILQFATFLDHHWRRDVYRHAHSLQPQTQCVLSLLYSCMLLNKLRDWNCFAGRLPSIVTDMILVSLYAGMKKFEYKGKQWHDECFICAECNQPIGNKSFIPRDDRVICVPCYESNYAQKCVKCSGVSSSSDLCLL